MAKTVKKKTIAGIAFQGKLKRNQRSPNLKLRNMKK